MYKSHERYQFKNRLIKIYRRVRYFPIAIHRFLKPFLYWALIEFFESKSLYGKTASDLCMNDEEWNEIPKFIKDKSTGRLWYLKHLYFVAKSLYQIDIGWWYTTDEIMSRLRSPSSGSK